MGHYSTSSDDAMHNVASAVGMAQVFILLILMSNFNGPMFSIYTTTLMNATDTTHTMDIEVEMFSGAPVYLFNAVISCIFAATTRRMKPDVDTPYTIEAISEVSPWEFGFWCTVVSQHATMVLYMCAPVDWYFLILTVCGITLVLLLIARLPFIEGAAQSRSNFLMLVCGALYFTLYTGTRHHGHVGYLFAMLIFDFLILIGHTFDSNPNMVTVSNSRLVYQAGMCGVLIISFLT